MCVDRVLNLEVVSLRYVNTVLFDISIIYHKTKVKLKGCNKGWNKWKIK